MLFETSNEALASEDVWVFPVTFRYFISVDYIGGPLVPKRLSSLSICWSPDPFSCLCAHVQTQSQHEGCSVICLALCKNEGIIKSSKSFKSKFVQRRLTRFRESYRGQKQKATLIPIFFKKEDGWCFITRERLICC